jgi:hypothetical protein
MGQCNYDKYKHVFDDEHNKLKTDDEYWGMQYEQ